jgi:hypothetical protein
VFNTYKKFKRARGRAGSLIHHGFPVVFILLMAVWAWGLPPDTGSSSTVNPKILEATQYPGTLMGLQYETWFTPGNAGSWETAEAVPVLGKYSSLDANVMRKHEAWFEDLGINWLLLDWSNMLWMNPAWEKHQGASHELEESTALLFNTYRQLEKEGKHPPKLVLMIGLQNGPLVPHAMERLNGIFAWTKKNFLDNPEYKDLWLYYHGKPLATILYWPPDPCKDFKKITAETALHAPDWTIRWMSTQLQDNHADRCGMWSWMDGPIRQIVTHNEGVAEETVVTPASFTFPGKGWRHPSAIGRDHGSPYLQSWKVAFESKPKFIQIHQWNEFAGAKEGQGFPADYWGLSPDPNAKKQVISNIYGDEYNLELSDDLEPVQTDKCAYRGCGGWGYYYMNLTKAILSLYRGTTPDITVMTLSAPYQPAAVSAANLHLTWETLGKQAASFTVQLDGKNVAEHIQGQSYALSLAGVSGGKHRVTLIADGAHTYFDLSPAQLASRSSKPLPVTSTIDFTYAPGAHKK